jgi:hypothetical protein
VLDRWRKFNPATTFIQRYRVMGEAFETLSLAAIYSLLHDQT